MQNEKCSNTRSLQLYLMLLGEHTVLGFIELCPAFDIGKLCKTHAKLGLKKIFPNYLHPSIDNCTIGLHSFNPRGVVS